MQLFARPPVANGGLADHCLDLLAWCLLCLGVGLRIWAARSISGRKSKEIIAEGAYSLCRNPLYIGTFLIGGASVLFLKSAWMLLAWTGVGVLYVCGVVPAEEEHLLVLHGSAYAAYCCRVNRWLPSFRNYQPISISLGSLKAWYGELSRSFWWLLIPLAAELTHYWRNLHPEMWLWTFP